MRAPKGPYSSHRTEAGHRRHSPPPPLETLSNPRASVTSDDCRRCSPLASGQHFPREILFLRKNIQVMFNENARGAEGTAGQLVIMVPDRPEREGRLHDQLLELESIRSAGLLTAAEHKSKREAVISRWEESQARILRQREVIETTLAENKAKTQQLLHALRATLKHGSDLLSKKQMAGLRQAYLELTGLSSLPSAVHSWSSRS